MKQVEEGIWFFGNGVTDGYEPPYECWELNLDPLEKQQMFWTSELSF